MHCVEKGDVGASEWIGDLRLLRGLKLESYEAVQRRWTQEGCWCEECMGQWMKWHVKA